MEVKKNKKAKILMIEDDLFYLKIYDEQLTNLGFEFIGAINGIEGMHKLLVERPDLVLLDLILPRENGFECLEKMKKNSETKNIPVLILSNLGQQSDIDAAMTLGAHDYLIKTDIRISDVVGKINQLLSKNKSF